MPRNTWITVGMDDILAMAGDTRSRFRSVNRRLCSVDGVISHSGGGREARGCLWLGGLPRGLVDSRQPASASKQRQGSRTQTRNRSKCFLLPVTTGVYAVQGLPPKSPFKVFLATLEKAKSACLNCGMNATLPPDTAHIPSGLESSFCRRKYTARQVGMSYSCDMSLLQHVLGQLCENQARSYRGRVHW